jgi:hypothetical protein
MLKSKLIGFLYLSIISHEAIALTYLSTHLSRQFQEIREINSQKMNCIQLVANTSDPNLWHKNVKLSHQYPRQIVNHQNNGITVLTLDQAQKLFNELKNVDYMAYNYMDNGCFARAHEFALIAKENGISMGKAFISDKRIYEQETLETNPDHLLYPKSLLRKSEKPFLKEFAGWVYHVAPYLLVKNNKGEVVPFVFDIGIDKSPKSIQKWKKSLLKDPSQADIEYRAYQYVDAGVGYSSHKSIIADELQVQYMSPSEYAEYMGQSY